MENGLFSSRNFNIKGHTLRTINDIVDEKSQFSILIFSWKFHVKITYSSNFIQNAFFWILSTQNMRVIILKISLVKNCLTFQYNKPTRNFPCKSHFLIDSIFDILSKISIQDIDFKNFEREISKNSAKKKYFELNTVFYRYANIYNFWRSSITFFYLNLIFSALKRHLVAVIILWQ